LQQVVHSIPVELVGVTKHQRFLEGSNEHSQDCQTDAAGSRTPGELDRVRYIVCACRSGLRLFAQDREEALALANHPVVMAPGRIERVGPPGEILAGPER